MKINKFRCIVGLSGGVDSATSVAIMKENGYEVIGCTLKMFESEQTDKFIADAEKIAKFLDVQLEIIDCINDFKISVIDYFVNSYENGLTPNPCVNCNKFVKFNVLYNCMQKYNADFLVTGHYARIKYSSINDVLELRQAVDLVKDQSYFLYQVNREILKKTKFPLGEYTKNETRELAEKFGIHVAKKTDSQDVCFLKNTNYVNFIQQNNSKNTAKIHGNIVNIDTQKILGTHDGIINYTIGQRKGLALSGGPFFVVKLDVSTNTVFVSENNEMRNNEFILKNVTFMNHEYTGKCLVKIRSVNKKLLAIVRKKDEQFYVKLLDKESAVAPEQSCVFYNDDIVIGGGIISE